MRSKKLVLFQKLSLGLVVLTFYGSQEMQIKSQSHLIAPQGQQISRDHFQNELESLERLGWRITPVFSQTEQKTLSEFNLNHLAQMVRIDHSRPSLSIARDLESRRQFGLSIEPSKLSIRTADRVDFNSQNWWSAQDSVRVPIPISVEKNEWIQSNVKYSVLGRALPQPHSQKQTPIRVAVIDTGVDPLHPNLTNHIAQTSDGLGGWNFSQGSGTTRVGTEVKYGNSDSSDRRGHGTHVAGIIAGHPSADVNYRGITSNALIIPIKVIDESPREVRAAIATGPVSSGASAAPLLIAHSLPMVSGPGSISAQTGGGSEFSSNRELLTEVMLRGFIHALSARSQVVNFSLGWPRALQNTALEQLIKAALDKGVIIVAAALNDGSPELVLPCGYERVICVASHDPDGALSSFSNYGAHVDVSAPGHRILSTIPNFGVHSVQFLERSGFDFKSGTSMAAPMVSGLIAELLSRGFNPFEARARLLASASYLPTLKNSRSPHTRINPIQTGAVQLDRALSVPDQPLFYPSQKASKLLSWDRMQNALTFEFEFTNLWQKADDIEVSAEVAPEFASQWISVSSQVARFRNWDQEEKKRLSFQLNFTPSHLPAQLDILVKFKTRQHSSSQVRRIGLTIEPSVDIRRLEAPAIAMQGLIREVARTELDPMIDLDDPGFKSRTSVFTVRGFDGSKETDFVLQTVSSETGLKRSQGRSASQLALIRSQRGQLRAIGWQRGPEFDSITLISVDRVNLDQSGPSEYVAVWVLSPTPTVRRERYVFQFFSSDFKPLNWSMAGQTASEVIFSPTETLLSPDYTWSKLEDFYVTPVWVGRGRLPAQQYPPYDPYDPLPQTLPTQRMYTIDPQGLSSIDLSADSSQNSDYLQPIGILRSTGVGTDAAKALWSLLQGRSKNGELLTDLIRLERGRVTHRIPLSHRVKLELRADQVKAPVHLESLSSLGLSGFVRTRSGQVEALVVSVPDDNEVTESAASVAHYRAQPLTEFEQALNVPSTFVGPFGGLFFETMRDLYYLFETRAQNQISAPASRRNYTFLGSQLRFQFNFGARVRLASTQEITPALYKASGLSLSRSIEVQIPDWASKRIEYPASLRITDRPGCRIVGSLLNISSESGSFLTQWCGSRMIFTELVL